MSSEPIPMVTMLVAVAAVAALGVGAARRAIGRRTVRRRLGTAHATCPQHRSIAARTVERWQRRRARGRSRATDLADLLDDVARRSASGHSVATAFLAAISARPAVTTISEIGLARDRLREGRSFGDSLAPPDDRDDARDPDVTLALHVLRLVASQGGSIAESLDRAASTLRERHAAHDERLAQSSQARLSAKVLTVVPIAFASWTVLTTATVQRFVLSPVGFVCAAIGIGLNILGWTLMQRAIDGSR